MKSFFHLPLYIYHSHGWITNTYCAKVCPFILVLYLCFSVKIVIFISSFFSIIVHLCLYQPLSLAAIDSLSLSGSIYRNISIYLYICLYLHIYLSPCPRSQCALTVRIPPPPLVSLCVVCTYSQSLYNCIQYNPPVIAKNQKNLVIWI